MTTEERADHYLASLRRGAAQLRQLADVWDSPDVDDRERMAFQAEWDNVIGRLATVEVLVQQGRLGAATTARLHDVADDLTSLVPIMHRLGLRSPDSDALARARTVTTA